MRHADLSLTVSQRKLACVLDPALVLCHAQGPILALRLTQVLEPWLTRSFWQVIDASELLLNRLDCDVDCANSGEGLQPDATALSAWIAMRDETDAGSWPMRWVDENLARSQVRDAAEPDVVDRYEQLAEALAERVAPIEDECARWIHIDPVRCAMDAVALSACLGGALILSLLPERGHGDPWPVQALARANVKVIALDPIPSHTLFAAEYQLLRDALVSAGLAAVVERLPPLAVVHVTVDEGAACSDGVGGIESGRCDLWANAQATWYVLCRSTQESTTC